MCFWWDRFTRINNLTDCKCGNLLVRNAASHATKLRDSELSDEAIKLRQHFRTLTPENQRALLEIAKVLSRLQRNG